MIPFMSSFLSYRALYFGVERNSINHKRPNGGAQERESVEVYSHTIQLTSLFASTSSCLRSSQVSNTKSSLHVLHRHGACSRLGSDKAESHPDHDDIFRHDEARVVSIQSKLSKDFIDPIKPSLSTDLPANLGSPFGSDNYIVRIGIGTPKQDLSLIFDTGSDLTWIQCRPCWNSIVEIEVRLNEKCLSKVCC
ncbi:unnamed protein product [Microthlaspi erraticum]|uniref:Peptidase A1 domain-containing protein n=1 Tax=Microthlaspi erraticum TaxID=1685480 RepID=A0A6D2JNK2_9BRAS|nr:unnamed protein product [Microthlaspi erraticum]